MPVRSTLWAISMPARIGGWDKVTSEEMWVGRGRSMASTGGLDRARRKAAAGALWKI